MNSPKIRFKGFSDDWEQRKLGEITDIASAARVHKEEWATSGVAFFRSSDVVAIYKNTENEKAFITEELYEKLSAISGKLEKDDILITGGGSIGIPYIVPNNEPLYSKDADLIWIKHSPEFDSNYLYAYVTAPTFRAYIGGISHIGTIAHYTIEQVKATPVGLPTIAEQRQIGSFFRSIDDLVTLHQQKCEETKTLKKYMLQKMFPQDGMSVPEIRFSGFTGDWEQRKLSELAERTYGGGTPATSNEAFWNGTIPWIQSSDITDGKLSEVVPRKYITNEALNKSAAQIVPENSIAIVTRVGVGKLAFMPFSYTTSQDFLSLSKLNTDPFFTVYACYKKLQSELNTVQGTSIKGITKDELLAKNIMVPQYREQEQIGNFFHSLDALITLHQRKCEELQNIKKFMLQNMFV